MRPSHTTACALLAVIPSALLAFSPLPPPQGYSIEAGEYRFVMLTTECVARTTEELVTPAVLEAIRVQERQVREVAERLLEAEASDPFPSFATPYPEHDKCDRRSLFARVEQVEEMDEFIRIRRTTFEKRFVPDVKSTTGLQYTVSGMYKNDGSVRPLWTVDWYAGDDAVNVSRHGHVVVNRDRIIESGDSVVEFYRRGKVVKSYSADDLLAGLPGVDRSRYFQLFNPRIDESDDTLSAGSSHHGLLVFAMDERGLGTLRTRYAGNDGRQQFSATVRRRDGSSIELRDFQMCGTSIESSMVSPDVPFSRHLFGMLPEHIQWLTVGEKTGAIAYEPPDGTGFFAVPFANVREFEPVPDTGILRSPAVVSWDPRIWQLTEINGTRRTLIVDSTNLYYCGRTSDLRVHVIRHWDSAGITFNGPTQ